MQGAAGDVDLDDVVSSPPARRKPTSDIILRRVLDIEAHRDQVGLGQDVEQWPEALEAALYLIHHDTEPLCATGDHHAEAVEILVRLSLMGWHLAEIPEEEDEA